MTNGLSGDEMPLLGLMKLCDPLDEHIVALRRATGEYDIL